MRVEKPFEGRQEIRLNADRPDQTLRQFIFRAPVITTNKTSQAQRVDPENVAGSMQAGSRLKRESCIHERLRKGRPIGILMTNPSTGYHSPSAREFVEEALNAMVERRLAAPDCASVDHRQQDQPALGEKTVKVPIAPSDRPAGLCD